MWRRRTLAPFCAGLPGALEAPQKDPILRQDVSPRRLKVRRPEALVAPTPQKQPNFLRLKAMTTSIIKKL